MPSVLCPADVHPNYSVVILGSPNLWLKYRNPAITYALWWMLAMELWVYLPLVFSPSGRTVPFRHLHDARQIRVRLFDVDPT